MVIIIELIDILLSHADGYDAHVYNISNTAYAETYRTIHPVVNFITTSNSHEMIEELYNEKYYNDGVSIKHRNDNLNVNFSFVDEQHHTMFVLKYG